MKVANVVAKNDFLSWIMLVINGNYTIQRNY